MIRNIAAALSMLILLSTSANAQWKKIADFIGTDGATFTGSEPVTCVYFLNLPGPPRIGFVGTASDIYKTNDGGKTWYSVWDSDWSFSSCYITDICFKDSLTGWATTTVGPGCLRTTDGGENWTTLHVPGGYVDLTTGAYYNAAFAVYYSDSSNRLFVASSIVEISTDQGNTWSDSLPYSVFSFSFSSGSNGVTVGSFSDTLACYLTTSDGGITWDTFNPVGEGGGDILSIPGTPTCFMDGSYYNTVRRSDDFGHTWKQIADKFDTSQYFTGIIRGNLSRLYIQSDSGMYVSTDQGITWKFDGGPPYLVLNINDRFYSGKGITVAGMTYDGDGWFTSGGLWEETWPQSGVSEQEPISNSFRVFPNPATDKLEITGGPAGTVRLFDLLGREVMETMEDGSDDRSSSGATLDVSKLLPGTYFLRVGTESAKVIIGR